LAVLKSKPVEDALRKHHGNMAAVGRKFGVTREAVRQYVENRPALKEVCLECRETMKDEAESALLKAIRKCQGWAVCFYLKCQAKDRGYVEKEADKPKDDGKGPGGLSIDEAIDYAEYLIWKSARESPATVPDGVPMVPERGAAVEGVQVSGG
jgi:hypothetical protein